MMIQPAEIVRLTFTVLLAKQIAWFRDDRRMKGACPDSRSSDSRWRWQ